MIYRLLIIKRIIEDLLIFPFILWGRWKARRMPLNKRYEIYFFFPFYHTGGAEKVHSLIAGALKDRKALIIFTRKSHDSALRKAFEASGHDIMDISAHTDDKAQYWNNLIYRGIYAAYINGQETKPVVFNGQSNFGYKLSRWVRRDIVQIELIHSFSSFSYIRVPFLPFYSETVMISIRRIEDHIRLYRSWGIPAQYDRRIRYICNGISLPHEQPAAKTGIAQQLLFVGRGTPEKRPALAATLAAGLEQQGLPITMGFVGDVTGAVDPMAYPQFNFYGNVEDPAKLDQLYRAAADILLVTSSEEGFPLVIMEAMARGVVIMATPVGDIPVHIQPQEHGWVFTTVQDEKAMLAEAAAFVLSLQNDPEKFHAMSARNIRYAYENFGLPTFVQQYRTLIENHLR